MHKLSIKTRDKDRIYVTIPVEENEIKEAELGAWDTLAYDRVGKCFSLRLSEVTCTHFSHFINSELI